MKQKIFTIYDSKAKAYLTPFFLHEDGMALRVFGDCVNDKTHQFGKHPEDYTLFNVGSWSDEKAKFVTNNPTALGNGIEFVDPKTLESWDRMSEDQKDLFDRKFTDPPMGKLNNEG